MKDGLITEVEINLQFKMKVRKNIFALGTGRCGTRFLAEVLKNDKTISSHHELDPLSDTFHRYFKWYNLPIDHAGFLRQKERSIEMHCDENQDFFESSAFLSMSISELRNHFDAKFILLVRDPYKVVKSYIKKGWYANEIILENAELPPSYQENSSFHHFMGRTLPKGKVFPEWSALSQVGKVAWYWNTLNKEVLRQLETLDPDCYIVQKLEDLDYQRFESICFKLFDRETNIDRITFEQIVEDKPNNYNNRKGGYAWQPEEIEEFKCQVKEMADVFGYDINKINEALVSPNPETNTPKQIAKWYNFFNRGK